jgi:hypothetical protein
LLTFRCACIEGSAMTASLRPFCKNVRNRSELLTARQ